MITRGLPAAAAVMALLATLAPGCMGSFDGPYPCDVGFASCNGPGTGGNPGCETSVASDPQNCGTCGTACGLGAVCQAGVCGAPAQILASDANPAQLGLSASNVFYWSTQGATLKGVAKTGGSPFPVSLPSESRSGGGALPFAVDDTNIYYAAMPQGMGPSVLSIDTVPPDGATHTAQKLATLSSGGQGSLNSVSAILQSAGTLYVLGNASGTGGTDIVSVPETGGAVSQVATFAMTFSTTQSAMALDATNFYALTNGNTGGCEVESVPLAGGTPSTIPLAQNGGCPTAIASDGKNLYWATPAMSYTTGQNGQSGQNGMQQCGGAAVVTGPIGGGTTTPFFALGTDEEAEVLVVDGTNLYVVTNQSVWRVAIATGTGVRIAANLGKGGSPCSGGGQVPGASVALDATDLYLAFSSTLIKVPK